MLAPTLLLGLLVLHFLGFLLFLLHRFLDELLHQSKDSLVFLLMLWKEGLLLLFLASCQLGFEVMEGLPEAQR